MSSTRITYPYGCATGLEFSITFLLFQWTNSWKRYFSNQPFNQNMVNNIHESRCCSSVKAPINCKRISEFLLDQMLLAGSRCWKIRTIAPSFEMIFIHKFSRFHWHRWVDAYLEPRCSLEAQQFSTWLESQQVGNELNLFLIQCNSLPRSTILSVLAGRIKIIASNADQFSILRQVASSDEFIKQSPLTSEWLGNDGSRFYGRLPTSGTGGNRFHRLRGDCTPMETNFSLNAIIRHLIPVI